MMIIESAISNPAKRLMQGRRATKAMFLACGLVMAGWASMVPFIKMELALSDSKLGFLLLLFGMGALVFMPLTGWIVKKVGSPLICWSSILVMAILLPCLPLVSSPTVLGWQLFLFGAANGACNIGINAQAVTIETKAKAHFMSSFHGFYNMGGLSGAGGMALLMKSGMPVALSALMISLFIAITLATQSSSLIRDEATNHPAKSSNRSGQMGKIALFAAMCFSLFIIEGAMLNWSALFLRTQYDYDVTLAGIGYALFSVAMAAGRYIGDRVIERLGAVTILRLGSVTALLGFALLVGSRWAYVELIGLVLIGFGAANIIPIIFSATGRLPGTAVNFALSFVLTFGYMGIVVGPALIGVVAEATTLTVAFSCLTLLLAFVGFKGNAVKSNPQETTQ